MATIARGERPRSSIDKKPVRMSAHTDTRPAFERLPDEIIQQILQATDSNGFASLALLNSTWRSVAQQAHLYALHLSNCPSYSMSHSTPPPASEADLPRLRRLFAREVKRNLFEAYLRPNKTVIKVISNSISSSSVPGGEGIQFNPSPKGQHVLAYNSSRIHVIDVRGPEVTVKREFKILRRPAATCINDEGSLLAVLLTEMQVDIYDLTLVPPRRSQSIILDNSPRAIALSPCGSVLAAAYEGGIEVSSLTSNALATDRRAVKCDAVDALAFSFDGTQILGTTVHSSQPNTVILTAPYYDPGSQMADDNISALWTTSILFPNTSRDCSHAVLLQNGKHEEASWTFTYDRSFETFRAVRIDDLRNGTTYFTGPVPSPTSQAKLIPCTLPAASYYGELVTAGFQGKEIWLYGVPEDLDAVPADATNNNSDHGSGSNANNLARRNSGPSVRSVSRMQENSEPTRLPQWQLISDKLRNTFVGGYKIGELEGVNTVKWVANFGESPMRERLIVAARNVSPSVSITDDESIDFVDGGRLTLIDFDYGVRNGREIELSVEVGAREPEVLEEEHRDMATEVAIVRRRTVAQQRGGRSAVMRSATLANRAPPVPTQPSAREKTEDDDDPLLPRRLGVPAIGTVEPPAAPEEGEAETATIEEQEALDAPYSHASPRSGTTLRRAATAAAVNRRLHPPPTTTGPVEYRRADGRTEHPHESDADNWVPPPPPYQKEDPGDLPDFMRSTLPPVTVSDTDGAQQSPSEARMATSTSQQPPRRSQTVAAVPRSAPAVSDIPPVPRIPTMPPVPQHPLQVPPSSWHRRGGSNSSIQSGQERLQRPNSSTSRYLGEENIYDVSPPDSPALGPRRPADRVSSLHPNESRAASNPIAESRRMAMPHLSLHTSNPQPPPGLHRIQTAPYQQSGGPPSLDLHIPSPSLHNIIPPGFNNVPAANSPHLRRLSNARTWPTQPNPPTIAAGGAGYPYSAPPMGVDPNAMPARLPPAPSADQLSSLNSRVEAPRRLSGGFQVPRVPVGSRTSGEYRQATYQRPLSQQQQHYPPYQQPQPQYEPRPSSQPQPPYGQFPPQPQYHDTRTLHPSVTPGTPQEEIPLIISTPKGVSGAYDLPDRRISGRRAEAPILAPVPRHPRTNAQAAVLRPQVERLETIYSIASSSNNVQQQNSLLVPGPGAPGSVSSGARVSSLNRKQSRAERSAAKNIADAKRRGWTGRTGQSKSTKKKKKQQKERDFDAASSAAWTDVTTATTFSHRSMGFGRGSAAGQHLGQARGERKCIVM